MIKQTILLLFLPPIGFSMAAAYELGKDKNFSYEDNFVILLFMVIGAILSYFIYDKFKNFFYED
jgi:hypothetical protein